jgi:hypothetical protein
MIDAEVIERAVWDHVVGLLSEPQRLVAQFERFMAETANGSPQEQAIGRQLQARLDRLGRADQRLLEAYQAEVISLKELAERRRAITEQHQAAVQQRDQHRRLAEQRVRAQAVLANVAAFSERICSRLKDADFGEPQSILQLIVERIVVHEDTLEIHHVIPLRDPSSANGSAGPAMPRDAGLRSDGVGPASGLEDRPRLSAGLVEPVEPAIGLRLQEAREPGQVALGVDALTISRVEERCRRRSGPGERAVVADVDPQAANPGPLLGQHRDRGVVAVPCVLADRLGQRPLQHQW